MMSVSGCKGASETVSVWGQRAHPCHKLQQKFLHISVRLGMMSSGREILDAI